MNNTSDSTHSRPSTRIAWLLTRDELRFALMMLNLDVISKEVLDEY